ncbi:MAG: tyrosine-type recombinase/integrase [Candidatus Izemoplasmatales bacterium]|nr:tyrosine-type recombinase/integrase [Candidatus Izemoplasmatales bacterium]
MTRRIKYKSTGKQQTYPIKSQQKIDEIMRYLTKCCEVAEKKNRLKRLYQARRNRMMVLLGFNTAFRAEDLLQLFVKDVENGYVTIREAKTNKTQNFKMNKVLHEEIKKYISIQELTSSDYLFTSQRSDGAIRCISRQQADRIIKDIKLHCRIHTVFGMHSLRKTFGYQYYANGGNLLTLQKMYNHEDSSTTLFYIMWDKNDMEKAREEIYIGESKRSSK